MRPTTLSTLIASAAAISVATLRRRSREGHAASRAAPPSPAAMTPHGAESKPFSMHDVPRRLVDNPETGARTAEQVRHLLRLRSRIDRIAWNTLGSGRMGAVANPIVADWPDRCMLLVSVGIAFEDMPEVLDHAMADPKGRSAHGESLHRAAQAYQHLAAAAVPARWQHGTIDREWRRLCEAVAEIIGQQPDYGVRLPEPGRNA